jgi:hypothetical protein
MDFSLIMDRPISRQDKFDVVRFLRKTHVIEVDRKRPSDGSTPLIVTCKQTVDDDESEISRHGTPIIQLIEVGGGNIDIRDNLNVSAWEHLLPLWQNINMNLRDIEISKNILRVYLHRSAHPSHVETALLVTKRFRDLTKRGREVRSALVDRRQMSNAFLGNRVKGPRGLPNDVVNMISKYDDDMTTEEMWAMI